MFMIITKFYKFILKSIKKTSSFIKRHPVNLISFIVILILIKFLLDDKNTSDLPSYSYIATIVSLLFVAIQAGVYVDEVKRNDNRLRKQKAVELAEIYEKELMPIISTISIIFDYLEIDKDIYSKIDDSKIKVFNIQELNIVLSQKSIQEYNKKINSVECLKYYSELKFMLNDIPIHQSEYIDKETNKNILDLLLKKNKFEFDSLIPELLNKLESFAMYFNYGIADEEVVYQSLHQTYKSTVKLLYIFIASVNDDPKNKYFTNIIELFNTWNKRYLKKVQKENKKLSELQEIGTHRGVNI